MTTWKYPVLAWQDGGGFVTAALVEFPDVAAWGETLDDVMWQVRELLEWRLENEPWSVGVPDFHDAELFGVKVPVRAEYRVDNALAPGWTHDVPHWMGTPRRERPPTWRGEDDERDERVYPVDPPIKMAFAAVRGRQASGLWACGMPMLGLRFYAEEKEKLKDLAAHYVQEALARSTPRDLARFQASSAPTLEQLVVRLSTRGGEAPTASPPNLAAVAAAMGEKSFRRGLMRAYGRAADVEALRARLEGERASVIVVGPAGVGKTALLTDAVNVIERRRTEEGGVRRRFWMTSAGRLIAAMRYLGQWQERCEALIEELDGIRGVLCVERLVDLVRVGGRGPADSIAAFLAPWVARGELRVVAEATPEELDACRRLLPGFVDLFGLQTLEAFPAPDEPVVLGAVVDALTQQTRVPFADAVAVTVARLFRRFVPYAGFPGRAVAFTRSLCTERDGQPRDVGDEVSAAEAVERFSRETGLPPILLRDEVGLDEDEVRASFRAQVIGQEEACEAAVRLLMTFKAGLHDAERPLAVLLFCGPTGVGKTELAKALARQFFGGEERLVRLDMSEFSGWGAADRLLGVSGGEPGLLIRRLREQPFSMVLLDEIEKADSEIFDLLLGVFDEGRLKDAYGRVTTFRSAVIVMTSNLGADSARSLGFTVRGEPSYEAEAMQFFRPEFFNRLDAVVRFGPLRRDDVRAIARKELAALARRDGLRSAGIGLEWSDAVVEHLADEGYDSRYGARPLQRVIEERVTTPLARLLAAHPDLRNCGLVLKMSRQGVDVDLA